jgi:hypothetical protein
VPTLTKMYGVYKQFFPSNSLIRHGVVTFLRCIAR